VRDKNLVVIAGPTAVGKTSLGIEIAERLGTEIISADSRQVYRETCIGTAVPVPGQLRRVRHHFIRCISLVDRYNASVYENQVLAKLDGLFKIYDTVLLVGGSGLYIDAVCKGIDDLPHADLRLREQLLSRYESEGLKPLVDELKVLDPESVRRIDLNNPMRVIKAVEVSMQTGKPYSSFLSFSEKKRPFGILRLALDMEREKLYERINARVDGMMEDGLLEEVKSLQHLRKANAMKTVGYRELFRYLDGEFTLEEAIDLIKRNTRKFARKQLTWFRKEGRYTWFRPDEEEKIFGWIREKISE
jgi:tRNA dimethylallyltransferase